MRRTAPAACRREGIALRIGLAALACAVAWALALPESASSKLLLPTCDRLLDGQEALGVMGEEDLAEQGHDLREGVLICTYSGVTEGTFQHAHGLVLQFQFYRVLTESLQFESFLAGICYVSLDGCHLAKSARRSNDNRKAFKLWAEAFKTVGHVRLLENGFQGDPALIWRPEHPPLEHSSFAIVYDEELRTGLLASCIESSVGTPSTEEPDNQCTVQALRRAYHNQATEFLPHPPHKH